MFKGMGKDDLKMVDSEENVIQMLEELKK